MNISFYTVKDNLDTTRGYGVAGFGVVRSLQELGHTVPFDDPSCPVQISLCSPKFYKFHPGQYKIGYTPWESTELPRGWLDMMNQCDEIWATSEWTAEVYRNAGVTVPVKVYMHGLEKAWEPVARIPGEVTKFLHVGEPALRKGGQMAVDAFRAAFGDRTDVHLTVKCYYQHYLRAYSTEGILSNPDDVYDNVTIMTDSLYGAEMRALYADHDVMVYPSYGEGFGFIPLQALGTGMPVICTDEWAPYREFLGPLRLTGRWDRSIWSLHPGDVYYPDYNMLVASYSFAKENLDYLNSYYAAQAEDVRDAFDWKTLTEGAFAHIVAKFG